MSFLDNLESNLKNLESHGETAESERNEQLWREQERSRAVAAGPWAERLKHGPFTADLLNHLTRIAYTLRVKVHMAWLGNTLRLEARNCKLELRPAPEGVRAVFFKDNQEVAARIIDLDSEPGPLAQEWLAGLAQ